MKKNSGFTLEKIAEQFDDMRDMITMKYPLSKIENDFYHDEDNVKYKVIRIKATYSVKKGDKWRIMEDGKVVFVVEGVKMNKKERTFLKTVDGACWLMSQAKIGIPTFAVLKAAIKKKLAGT